uniref:Uncharacterized protein n=1 Tax=Ditylenchus dipsaci TaxID=166011 RepID=A0A915DX47_9BILA
MDADRVTDGPQGVITIDDFEDESEEIEDANYKMIDMLKNSIYELKEDLLKKCISILHEVPAFLMNDDNVRSDICLMKCDTGLILKRDGGPCLVYETYSCSVIVSASKKRIFSREAEKRDEQVQFGMDTKVQRPLHHRIGQKYTPVAPNIATEIRAKNV